jgi:hypothetical protein
MTEQEIREKILKELEPGYSSYPSKEEYLAIQQKFIESIPQGTKLEMSTYTKPISQESFGGMFLEIEDNYEEYSEQEAKDKKLQLEKFQEFLKESQEMAATQQPIVSAVSQEPEEDWLAQLGIEKKPIFNTGFLKELGLAIFFYPDKITEKLATLNLTTENERNLLGLVDQLKPIAKDTINRNISADELTTLIQSYIDNLETDYRSAI